MAVGHWAEEYLPGGNGAAGGGVSVYEVEIDSENMTLVAKVSAGELFDAAQHGEVLLHGLVNMSDTAYQESAFSIISSVLQVSGANKGYAFSVISGDSVIALRANSSDAFPTVSLSD